MAEDWQSLAVKVVAGITAAAAVGFAIWTLSKEDEAELISPAVFRQIGKIQFDQSGYI